jgi:hypothetical protein
MSEKKNKYKGNNIYKVLQGNLKLYELVVI